MGGTADSKLQGGSGPAKSWGQQGLLWNPHGHPSADSVEPSICHMVAPGLSHMVQLLALGWLVLKVCRCVLKSSGALEGGGKLTLLLLMLGI